MKTALAIWIEADAIPARRLVKNVRDERVFMMTM
jgi:hypothetical protein